MIFGSINFSNSCFVPNAYIDQVKSTKAKRGANSSPHNKCFLGDVIDSRSKVTFTVTFNEFDYLRQKYK